MRNAVFLDNNFIQHFLTSNSGKLEQVLRDCRNDPAYPKGWSLPKSRTESGLCKSIVAILNTIKRAVHRDAQTNNSNLANNSSRTNDGSQASNGSTPSWFLNNSARGIPADDADFADTKPGIVLFDGRYRHWETVRMAFEVKLKPSQLKEGMEQLSRYARAVYAHQLHRRHLYGLVICGPEVTFVRFDRAGILHSPKINMCESSEVFTRAFASLLMLDRTAEGYDSAFSTSMNKHLRLEYYVDLPESAFGDVPVEPSVVGPSGSSVLEDRGGAGPRPRILPMRRFKVIERLCHRKSIRGRATIVLRIQEVPESDEATVNGKEKRKGKRKAAAKGNKKKRKADDIDQPQQPGRPDYILKLIWRDPGRESEGDVLKMLVGMFGLAQYVWHCDVAGECRCGVGGACRACVDDTPQLADLEPSTVMNSSGVPPEDAHSTASTITNVKDTGTASCARNRRIYSRILMSSVGEPLWAADSAEEFLNAILDAILGYWRLVNLGILHRDISDGNVMMLRSAHGHARQNSDEECTMDLEELEKRFGPMAESEAELRKVLSWLNRPSTGMMTDFDMHSTHLSPPASRSCSKDGVFPNGEPGNCPPPQPDAPSKRRKTNTGSSVSITVPSVPQHRAPAERSYFQQPDLDEGRPAVDLPIGTPMFMSVRVLKIQPGDRYTHTFMDDLQSFFWLILWSVAAHHAPDCDPTPGAQYMMDSLEQEDLGLMARLKTSMLVECVDGQTMQENLRSFKNSWSSNNAVVNLIIGMGSFFFPVLVQPRLKHEPSAVFPKLVKMILIALGRGYPE